MHFERQAIFGANLTAVAIATSLAFFAAVGTTLGESRNQPIQITARPLRRAAQLCHADVDLQVSAGPLTLTTPQWIPARTCPQDQPWM